MLLSGFNLAVTAVGFAVLFEKLTNLDRSLTALRDSVKEIARLMELNERAKLKATLKILAMVIQEDSVATRESLLNRVLHGFGPVNMKYRDLLPKAKSEAAMACQEYFVLTSLATVVCAAELGMVRTARRYLDDDYAFWAPQARRIANDFLGKHPERFVAGEHSPYSIRWCQLPCGDNRKSL